MLKGGVQGFGGVGQEFTSQINRQKFFGDDVKIVACCNRGKEKRDLAKDKFGIAAYDNVDDLIAHGIDFMLIVSSNLAHHEAAIKCAKAKIPYFIEKPIAPTIEEAREIASTAAEAGIITGVNYSMRYRPLFLKMKSMVDSGQLGDLLAIWCATHRGYGFYSSGDRHAAIVNTKESGGWIVHHMCHIVDWCIWCAGAVEEVYALTRSTAPAELDSEELIFATIKFKNGAIGTLQDQVGKYWHHDTGIIGTKGSVGEVLENVEKKLLKFFPEGEPFRPGMQWAIPHIIDPDADMSLESGLAHFIRCLQENRPTKVPVSEALYSLEVCNALRRSAKERRPIRMD
ncbi:MAG: Gfo/Idh/MocA family oxidoreductase [Phycisphaerales bacterium]|nr:Gfo/Idh/MocA family oxidoreductase [Phycisphaerales bacterium]